MKQGSIAVPKGYFHNPEEMNWDTLFEAIQEHFTTLDVPISEVIYWGRFIHVVLEQDATPKDKLPCRVGSVNLRYLYEKDMKRPPALQAGRTTDKSNAYRFDQGLGITMKDDSQHPGVRVSSDYVALDTREYITTVLGVKVRDAAVNDYITVAGLGFPPVCGKRVYTSLRDDNHVIGNIEKGVGATDVALMPLVGPFRNEVFFADVDAIEEITPLCGLREPRRFDIVKFNSRDTGCHKGQVLGLSRQKIPHYIYKDIECWVRTTWIFHGQDTAYKFPGGMRGTPVLGEDNKVLSLFRYGFQEGPWENWSVGTSAEELIKRGFT